MIHRRLAEDGRWETCDGTDVGHEPDSRVHRFDREVGFILSQEEQAMVGRNPLIAQAERGTRTLAKQSSHAQTVRCWALFERYLLKTHPEEEYTKYIAELERHGSFTAVARAFQEEDGLPLPDNPGLVFKAPPALLLITYAQFLRKGSVGQIAPDRKGTTITKYTQACINSVLKEFGFKGESPAHDQRLRLLLAEYADGEVSAVAFDVEIAMPKLHTAVWTLRGWNVMRRLRAWAMFLVAMCIMARASDMTTYCPDLDDLPVPALPEPAGFCRLAGRQGA